jgi:hypothetical protein
MTVMAVKISYEDMRTNAMTDPFASLSRSFGVDGMTIKK